MVFWGKVVSNKKTKVIIPEGGSIHFLQICQEEISSITSSVFLKTVNEKEGFLLCHLGGNNPQFSLCHEVGSEDSPFEIWTVGGKVHITGNAQEGEDDEGCGDDEEEEEEEIQALVELAVDTLREKRTRSEDDGSSSIEEIKIVKKLKTTKSAPTGAEVAADIVLPQTHQQRKKWKIKPQNDEGILVLEPKSLKKASGISMTDYIIGKGAEPKLGAKVKITYEGSYPDGTIFDQCNKRSKPFSFRKGTAQVIRGLDLGLEGMRIGGSREIVIPSELG